MSDGGLNTNGLPSVWVEGKQYVSVEYLEKALADPDSAAATIKRLSEFIDVLTQK